MAPEFPNPVEAVDKTTERTGIYFENVDNPFYFDCFKLFFLNLFIKKSSFLKKVAIKRLLSLIINNTKLLHYECFTLKNFEIRSFFELRNFEVSNNCAFELRTSIFRS